MNIEGTSNVYTGGYNTSMVFDYDKTSGRWKIAYWQNLLSNVLNITLCGSNGDLVSEGSCPKPEKPDDIKQKERFKPSVGGNSSSSSDSSSGLKIIGKSSRSFAKPGKRNLDGYFDSVLANTGNTLENSIEILQLNTSLDKRDSVSERTRNKKIVVRSNRKSGNFVVETGTSNVSSDNSFNDVSDFESLKAIAKKKRATIIRKSWPSVDSAFSGSEGNDTEIYEISYNETESSFESNSVGSSATKAIIRKRSSNIRNFLPSVGGNAVDADLNPGNDTDSSYESENEVESNSSKVLKQFKSIKSTGGLLKGTFSKRVAAKDGSLSPLLGGESNNDTDTEMTASHSKASSIILPTAHPTSAVKTPSIKDTGSLINEDKVSISKSIYKRTGNSAKNGDEEESESNSTSVSVSTHTENGNNSSSGGGNDIVLKPRESPKIRKPHSHSVVAKGYPSTLLKVQMADSRGLGWFKPDYLGTYFYISDESKTDLIAYGTLENGSYTGFCQFCFDDGSFYFRVMSDKKNPYVTWSFCNTEGTYGQQLAFHIKGGKCIPDALLDVDMVCESSYSTVVTVRGVLALAGVQSEILDEASAWVITSSLSESVYGWENSEIRVSGSSLNLRSSVNVNRALTTFTHDVEFEATFVTEIAYDIDGTSYYGVLGLVSELQEELSGSVASGQFASLLRSLALSSGVVALDEVQAASLVLLDVEEITYVGVKDMVLTADNENIGEMGTEDSSASSVSWEPYYAFVAVVSLGLFAVVGLMVLSVKINSAPTHIQVPGMDVSSSSTSSVMSNHMLLPKEVRSNVECAL